MTGNAPTLINLPPPPPSDAVTPSDIPGTPNSGTTSMSELSTVAIKDGHRGHLPHHQNPMDAERADRISRLAGLERVVPGTTAPRNPSNLAPYAGGAQGHASQAPAYFDQNNNPQIMRERSTVGSASATGSVGGRTTWASGSDVYDPDKMSEDQDIPASADGDRDAQMEAETASSVGGFSDEAASLVGFGEGARTPARAHSTAGGGPGSPVTGKVTPTTSGAVPGYLRGDTPQNPSSQGAGSTEGQRQDARMIDGMTYDAGVVDTVSRTPPPATGMEQMASGRSPTGAETAERIMGDTFERHEAGLETDGSSGLGKFGFEGRRGD
ncbi:hypothetical protein NA57DRAFT_38536 [Rhizodiscina lignyota]|uniref:Uncharacterized protein n=1 Tax=Rhizodiscina lignyota TaxID=1504668 RepID=A0A9P4IHL6_9PEZI|nr:hypothetical protein NA57DRAFT_38536 [Rhizodiscina lignyota]